MPAKSTKKSPGPLKKPSPATQKASLPTPPRPPNGQQPARPAVREMPSHLEWSFGYLFKQANRAFTRALATRLKPHGITLAQWYFLRELWQEEGITQRELSRRMDVSEPTTAVAIDVMEKAGLIERQRDPTQRNSINVTLTRKGRLLKSKVLHIALDVNANAMRGLAPENLQAARETILLMVDGLGQDPGLNPAIEAATSPAAATGTRRAA